MKLFHSTVFKKDKYGYLIIAHESLQQAQDETIKYATRTMQGCVILKLEEIPNSSYIGDAGIVINMCGNIQNS